MSAFAVLIATVRVRPGMDDAFALWKAKHDTVIGKFPGFVGNDTIPPSPPGSEWTLILNFRTPEDATAWQRSPERREIVAQGVSFFEGGTLGEVVQTGGAGSVPDSTVTEVIFSRIKPGREGDYRDWAARIQAAQAKYPGYRGEFIQPPSSEGGMWTTIIRFDTVGQLEAWLNAPERKKLLEESQAFVESEQHTQLATSFPGWVPVDPATGQGPPDWKTAMLVLLVLFPVVMLEMRFLSPVLSQWGLHASLATFIGNAISVAITSLITMPLMVRWFGWWLFPTKDAPPALSLKGVFLLLGLYTLEVATLWRLLPW